MPLLLVAMEQSLYCMSPSPSPPLPFPHTAASPLGGQLGCISALRSLAECYPPVQYAEVWNCNSEASVGWLSLLVPILTSSWVTHHLQGHAELIDFLTKFMMGVAIKNVGESPRKGPGLAFSALTSVRLAELAQNVLCHLLKLLNVFSHVIEGKDADQKLSKVSCLQHNSGGSGDRVSSNRHLEWSLT